MRVLFLLVFAAGAVLGIGYPWAALHLTGHELGTYRVYERATGYKPVEVALSASDAPLRVSVDLRIVGGTRQIDGHSILSLTVTGDGRSMLAVPLTFAEATLKDKSAETNERIYRDDAGLIPALQNGIYTFSVQSGEETGIYIQSVDIILRADAFAVYEVVRTGGFLLMAAGITGLIFAMIRHRRMRWRQSGAQLRELDEN